MTDASPPRTRPERAPSRRRTRPSVGYGLASVAIHVVGVALAMGAAFSEPDQPDFISYQIELVSLGEGGGGDLVIEAPPSAPAVDETTPAVPEPEPEPAPEPDPAPPEPEPAPRDPTPPAPSRPSQPSPTQPSTSPSSSTGSGDSGDAINVRMEGLRRDYPVYYRNIITQIQRCFRWSAGGTPQTEIYFVINADGTVSDIDYVRRSGNPAFDIEAMGAVECAGQAGRFGPLPDDLPYEQLPIRFTFRPGGGAGIFR